MPKTYPKYILSVVGACALLATASSANDENQLLSNPGFEDPNPIMPDLPIGWNTFNMSAADYVDINDPGAEVRSGDRSIRLRPATDEASRFRGLTTNLFRPDGSDLFDPDYEYLGGDVTVSGYYLVPEGEVIQDTIVGVKLEFRREPPNFSIWSSFEFPLPAASTGGEWMPFSVVVTDAMIEAVGDFPPEPTSVSVLPFRFFGGEFGAGTSPTGTVFIDDLCVVQGASACPADLNGDEILDIFDVLAFIDAFNANDLSVDYTDDGVLDIFDVLGFIDAFNAGCP